VNDLKSFVALQARLYKFLEQQDETTLQAIVSGTAELAVLRPGEVREPVRSAPREDATGSTMVPSSSPVQVAQDLSRLPSEHERRIYLNAAGMPVKELKKVAKLYGLAGYSALTRAKLVNLLASHGLELAGEPSTPADTDSTAEQRAITQEPEPTTVSTELNADAADIASRLREAETEEEGAAYLHAQHLDRENLLAVAAELQLTRVNRLSQTELEKRVLKQAIGARRKFAGLRRW
jgi:hypothetical protein